MYEQIMEAVFELCVLLLMALAEVFNTTYVVINVWVFCVIWPLVTLGLVVWVAYLLRVNKRHREKISKLGASTASLPMGAFEYTEDTVTTTLKETKTDEV